MTGVGHTVKVLTSSGLEEVGIDALPQVLEDLKKKEGPVTWIHSEADPRVLQQLDDMGLDEIGLKSLRDGPERPRVEEFADHIYVSLFSADRPAARRRAAPAAAAAHKPAPAAAASAAVTAGKPTAADEPDEHDPYLPHLRDLRLFLGPRWIISAGHLHKSDYDDLADRVRKQVLSRGRGASFIAYHICEWLVESLQPVLERLDERIDSLEDQVVLATGKEPIQALFSLKRDLVELRRRVAPLRDVMQRLGSHGVSFVEADAEVYFRDVHDDVMRVIELLDTYRDILSSALDLHLSSVSNRLNQVMKQLTVVATIFMPLSFIVGLFGTNFQFMPFRSYFWFLMMFVLLGLSIAGILTYTWRKT